MFKYAKNYDEVLSFLGFLKEFNQFNNKLLNGQMQEPTSPSLSSS